MKATLRLSPPARSEELEQLDFPSLHAAELGPSLAEVRRVNRLLGGTAVALRFIRDRPELHPGAHASLLDVASGSADIPMILCGWSRRAKIQLDITATDLSPEVLEQARRHLRGRSGIALQVADAASLPYADASFDYVTCNLALHHFPPAQAASVIREMYRVARRAILVNDLARSRPAYWGARLLFLVVLRDPMARHDGPLSVLRSYTAGEMGTLGRQAGLPVFTVKTRPVFRLELIAEK